MGSMIDYVKEFGDISMKDRPFGVTDALVLSQFVYLKWEHIIPRLDESTTSLTLKQMDRYMKAHELAGEVFMDDRYAQDNKALWEAMLSGRRFNGMKCNYLVEDKSREIETQFLAITVFPEGSLPVIVFRGTDETMLGWKEDFNMAYRCPVPGQTFASLYLKQVSLRLNGGFMMAGHSKGGNLALYSTMTAPKELRDRVMNIYNFDGPGFKTDISDRYAYDEIVPRVTKLIPESSVVGIILEREGGYKAVSSTAKGAFQHNMYSWVIKDGEPEYLSDIRPASRMFMNSITKWMEVMSDEELEAVFGTVYELLASTNAETTIELTRDRKAPVSMLKALIGLPDDTKEKARAVLKEFKIIM